MTDDLELRLTELLERQARVAPDTIARTVAAIDELPPRRRARIPTPLLAVAAVVVVALVGLVIASLVRAPADVAAPSVPAPTGAPTAGALQPRPVWAIDLASHLACAGPASAIGREITSDSAVSAEGQPTPEAAFDAIRSQLPALPPAGYTGVLVDDHWALQRLLVDGQPKVHMIATDQLDGVPPGSGWRVVGLRMCDPGELSGATVGSPS